MFPRSYILFKCIPPPVSHRSSALSDIVLGLPLGCTHCQAKLVTHKAMKICHKAVWKGWQNQVLQLPQQRKFSRTHVVYCKKIGNSDFSPDDLSKLNMNNVDPSDKKAAEKILQDNKEESNLLSKDVDIKPVIDLKKAKESLLLFKQQSDIMRQDSKPDSILPQKDDSTISEELQLQRLKEAQLFIKDVRNKLDTKLSKEIEKEAMTAIVLSKADVIKSNASALSQGVLNLNEISSKPIVLATSEKEDGDPVQSTKNDSEENKAKFDDTNKSKDAKKPTEKVEAPASPKKDITQPKLLLEKAKSILRKTATTSEKDEKPPAPKPPPKRREMVDLNRISMERNFITPVRAMADFLLKPSDLEGLRKTKRRSPYENDPPITVYWRKDVEVKAIEVWGSKDNLLKELMKRDIERKRYQQIGLSEERAAIFTAKRKLRDYRREQGRETEIKVEQEGLMGPSGKVVMTAILINGMNFALKAVTWWFTGSHSMFSEAVHSLSDTVNQIILAYGIHKSVQSPDPDHPYGYTNMRYVSSLISGVGIFFVGAGLSSYHGVLGLISPTPLDSLAMAFCALGISLASEGATLYIAFTSIRKGAKSSGMSFSEYVWRSHDPSVNVVLLEDMAAVVGVSIAGSCLALSSYLNTTVFDAIGSLLVGGVLGGVACFIITTNVTALVGRSISQERLDVINSELESDVMIRAIHDVKGIDMGNSLVRYKAEMDFDGGELTRSYLDKQDLNQMLEEVKNFQTIDELEQFLLKHGENIVDMLGGEIDRIELKLRKKHPEIRHCDLEIL